MFSHFKKYVFFLVIFLCIPSKTVCLKSLPELLGFGPNTPPQSEKSPRAIRARTRARKKPYKTIKMMTFAELKEKKDELLASCDPLIERIRNHSSDMPKRRKICKEHSLERMSVTHKKIALKYLEQMLPLCADIDEQGLLIFELASLNFDCGNLETAQKKFEEFVTLYPGHAKTEEALKKQLLCTFYMTLRPECDQSKTHEALEIANKFLERADLYTTHHTEVLAIKRQCEKKVIENELAICQFYYNRPNMKAAKKRLDDLKEKFTQSIQELPEIQQTIASLEQEINSKYAPARVPSTIFEKNPLVEKPLLFTQTSLQEQPSLTPEA